MLLFWTSDAILHLERTRIAFGDEILIKLGRETPQNDKCRKFLASWTLLNVLNVLNVLTLKESL